MNREKIKSDAPLGKSREHFNDSGSTHWVVYKCLGSGSLQSCPLGTKYYYGNKTSGVTETITTKDKNKGERIYMQPRYCACGSGGKGGKHRNWKRVGTMSDVEYKEKIEKHL